MKGYYNKLPDRACPDVWSTFWALRYVSPAQHVSAQTSQSQHQLSEPGQNSSRELCGRRGPATTLRYVTLTIQLLTQECRGFFFL